MQDTFAITDIPASLPRTDPAFVRASIVIDARRDAACWTESLTFRFPRSIP